MRRERIGREVDVTEFDGAALHGGNKLVALTVDASVTDRAVRVVPDGERRLRHRFRLQASDYRLRPRSGVPSTARARDAASAASLHIKHAIAHLVDHLARLGKRERGGVLIRHMAVGTDELVLAAHARDVLLDHPRGLILAAVL